MDMEQLPCNVFVDCGNSAYKYIKVPRNLLYDRKVSSTGKIVYLLLLDRAAQKKHVSIKGLVTAVYIAPAEINKALDELVRTGWLIRHIKSEARGVQRIEKISYTVRLDKEANIFGGLFGNI